MYITHVWFEINLLTYLLTYMHRRNRSLIAQFRLGILPLYIETERYDNTPVANRIGKVCDSRAVEDEFNYVMQCSRYTVFMEVLYNKSSNLINDFFTNSDNGKFVLLCKYSQNVCVSIYRKCLQQTQANTLQLIVEIE